MKKILAVMLCLVMVLGVFAGCGDKKDNATDRSGSADTGITPVSEMTTLTVGFDAEYAPYGYKDDSGEYVGFDLDLAQEVCDRMGWELKKQPINWDAKDMELNSGTIDCIWNGFTMTGREDKYTFSVPYVDNSIVFIVMNDSDIQTAEDLAGKVVGVQLGTSADIPLQNEQKALADTFDGGEPVRFENYNVCFTELQAGSIDALAIDYPVAAAKIAEYGDGYVMLDESIASEEYGICFRKDDAELCQQVEDAFMQLVEDGTYVSLAEKYGLETSSLCLSK